MVGVGWVLILGCFVLSLGVFLQGLFFVFAGCCGWRGRLNKQFSGFGVS